MTLKMSGRRARIDDGITKVPAGGTVAPDLVGLVQLLRARARLIIAVTAGVMLLSTIGVLLMADRYRSVATILPTGGVNKMSQLQELAGLGGLMLEDDNTSELFPVVLRSRLVRTAILNHEYTFTHDGEPMRLRLTEYVDGDNLDKKLEALDALTTIRRDKKTGVITVAVETEYPELSRAVNRRFLEELEDFNLRKRRTSAGDRADYLAGQLDRIRSQLALVEDSLEQLRQSHRDWSTTTDPSVLKALSRLQREVEVKSMAYLYLSREYETARLEAQKDVPIVRILDAPSLPVEPAGPPRLLLVAVCTGVTFFGVVFILLGIEVYRRQLQVSAPLTGSGAAEPRAGSTERETARSGAAETIVSPET